MKGMVLSFQVGVVEVKAEGYKTVCLENPERIIAVLETQLPQLANTRCDLLSNEIKVSVCVCV